MKLLNLINKISKYRSNANEFNKIEIFSKKLNDLKLLSSYINNNFKVKRSGLFNYIPKDDAYRIRLIIENNIHSQEYTNMIRSFAFNNKMKTAIINEKDFIDNVDLITVNNINEVKPLLSMIDINLMRNDFKRDSYNYYNNSLDFNDICGNYIQFIKENSKKIDVISFGIEDTFNPTPISELDKHKLVKFLEFLKLEPKLNKKLLAIKTSNCQIAELMLNSGVHIIYDESGATLDSNILSLAKDNNVNLFLGNHLISKNIFEALKFKDSTYDQVFIHSLLERMDLLYSKGILNHNVYFDPCYHTLQDDAAAKDLFDNMNLISKNYEFQVINSPRIRTKNYKEEFITEQNRNSSSIIKFDCVQDFKFEYNRIFKDLKNNPIPNYSEKHIRYNDYGIIVKEQEKVLVTKNETDDIFSRDRNNFVKDDVILNIMKKINKN